MVSTVRFLDEQATYAAATIGQCADALEAALRAGLPGEPDPARIFVDLPPGEMLLMPSRVTGTPTVKLITRAGMGWCQGRVCGPIVDGLCGFDDLASLVGAATRPVAAPVPLGALATMPVEG